MDEIQKVESPAIVVLAYNRPKSLLRLLECLRISNYNSQLVTLIISIDYQESVNHEKVLKIAESFVWDNGEKIVLCKNENLGLKKHVLACGDLSYTYGSIIMLEDDILVSPNFYFYAQQALLYYNDDSRIGGVSLYRHRKNFCNRLSFELIGERDTDVFFLQIASSWGQAWTKEQWDSFKEWHNKGQVLNEADRIPSEIINWPSSSWLKLFIKYLVDTNKYFVYPKVSLSTNFGDSGTHNKISNSSYQVPLDISENINYKFVPLEEAINVYDAYFEIDPERLKRLIPALDGRNFIVDIYGRKDLNKFNEEFAISSKRIAKQNVVSSYGMNLKPLCLNLVLNNEGEEIFFGKRIDFLNKNVDDYLYVNKWDYFSNIYSTKMVLKRLLFQIKGLISK